MLCIRIVKKHADNCEIYKVAADLPPVLQLKHTKDRTLLLDFAHCALVISLIHLDGMILL